MSEEKDWDGDVDDSDNEEYVNLAFREIRDEHEASSSSNHVLYVDNCDISSDQLKIVVDQMTNDLYHAHVTIKTMTKENTKLNKELVTVRDRNVVLEQQLIELENAKCVR